MLHKIKFKRDEDTQLLFAYDKKSASYPWCQDVIGYSEHSKCFSLCHEDNTKSLIDKKGNVLPNAFRKPYIEICPYGYATGESNTCYTLYSWKGKELEGTQNSRAFFYSDGSYVGQGNTYYNNGANRRRLAANTVYYLAALGILSTTGYIATTGVKNFLETKDIENAQKATYLKTLRVQGQDVMYFDTDNNLRTAEYTGVIKDKDYGVNFLNLQKGEKRKISEWEDRGASMNPLNPKKVRDYE